MFIAPADILDDLGASEEGGPDLWVTDEVEVPLTVPCLLILETEMGRGGHMEAGREDGEGAGEDGQLALLGLSGEPHNADDVASLGFVVDRLELDETQLRVPRISHHLDLVTLSLEVIEEELGARGTLAVDASGDGDGHVGELLACLEGGELLDKLGHGHGDVELVRVGVDSLCLLCLDGLDSVLKV